MPAAVAAALTFALGALAACESPLPRMSVLGTELARARASGFVAPGLGCFGIRPRDIDRQQCGSDPGFPGCA